MDEVRVKEEVPMDVVENKCDDQNTLMYGVSVKEEPEDFSSLDTAPFDEITIKAEKIEPYITSDDHASDAEPVPVPITPIKTLASFYDGSINWNPRVYLTRLNFRKRPKERSSSDEDESPSELVFPRRRSIKKPSRFNSQEFGTYEELIAIRKTMKIAKALDNKELKNMSKIPKSVDEGSTGFDGFTSSLDDNFSDLDDNFENFEESLKMMEKTSESFNKNTKSSNKNSSSLNKVTKRLHKSSKSSHKVPKGLVSKPSSKFSTKKPKNSAKRPTVPSKKPRKKSYINYDDGIDSSNDDAVSLDLDSDDDGPIVMKDLDFLDGLNDKNRLNSDAISLDSEESDEEETGGGLPRKPRISDFSLFCNDCKVAWEGDCPKHGPLIVVKDLKVVSQNVHSMMTVPPQVYIGTWGGYRVADNPKNGKGVFAKKKLPSRMRFGPLQGKIVSPDTPETWLVRKNGKPFRGIDVSAPGTSNWMRYVRVSRNESEVNCDAYQYQGLIFFKTIREISPQEELVVGAYDYNGFLLKQDEDGDSLPDESLWGSALEEIVPSKDNEDPDANEVLCTICFESFTSKFELEEHIATHDKEKPFACSKCNKRFADQSMLIVHENNHSVKGRKHKENPVVCPECNKTFSSKSSLKKHSRLHTGEKAAVKKPTSEMLAVKKHTSVKHAVKKHNSEKHAVKKHTCEKSAVKNPSENLLSCHVCRAKFSSKELLESHSIASSDNKLHECMVCSKRFKVLCALNKHMHIHSCC